MARTINITIQVNITNLIANYPNGGTVITQNIINMFSNSGEDTWENNNPAKLITIVDPSDVLIWQIVPASGIYTLALNQFIGDASKDLLLVSAPAPVPGSQNTQWTSIVKSSLSKNTDCTYCFKFTSNYGRDVFWQWDPRIRTRL
jgi:hypothetical protein